MTWQLIETAPERKPVLVYDPTMPPFIGVAEYHKNFVGWFCLWDMEGMFNPTPTHWMPLPEPPQQREFEG